MAVRRVKIEDYLTRKDCLGQGDLAEKFGRTQSWLSQIKSLHPEARIVIIDGDVEAIEYVNHVRKEAVAISD